MDERDRLLAAIAADPDAIENWIVYADWLTERDDPRGELINLELAIEAGATDEAVVERHRALVRDEEGLLSPRLAEQAHHLELQWWRGFIRAASAFGPDDDPPTREDLEALYADPHACIMRTLTLPAVLHHTLATLTCTTVRSLFLGSCRVTALPLAQGFPLLEDLDLSADLSRFEEDLPTSLEEVAHPQLLSFSGPASALRRHDLPRLRSLATADAIALFDADAILSRPPQSLTRLSLGDVTADVIAALRASPVLPQLRELCLQNAGAEQVEELIRDPRPFQHLSLVAYGISETSTERDELVGRLTESLPAAKIEITAMDSYEADNPGDPPPIDQAIGDSVGGLFTGIAQRMRDRNSGKH